MIITRSPVRIGLAGGGTDLPAFYRQYGGRVLNAAINRYVYVILSANRRGSVQLTSSDFSQFLNFDAGTDFLGTDSLALVRAVLADFGLSEGVDVFTASETPPGTGLGSSSATAVSLVKAVSTFLGLHLSDHEVAERACTIELDRLRSPIGKQDQYGSAFGGFNVFEFAPDGTVTVRPLDLPAGTVDLLERRLQLYFTGVQREANQILRTQSENISGGRSSASRMTDLLDYATRTEEALLRGDLDTVGELIRVGWERKRGLASGISSDQIDVWIARALEGGALGAKLTGAGGGGYLLAMAGEGQEERLRRAMLAEGLKPLDYRFDWSGARVLMNSERRAAVMV